MVADSGGSNFRILRIPRVSRLAPIMSQRRDLTTTDQHIAALGAAHIAGKTSLLACCRHRCDNRVMMHRQGNDFLRNDYLAADRTVAALSQARGGAGGGNRFVRHGLMSKWINIGQHFRLNSESLVLKIRTGVSGFAGLRAGGLQGDHSGYSDGLRFNMLRIIGAGPGDGDGGVVGGPSVDGLAPAVAQGIHILQRLRLHGKGSVLKAIAGVCGFAHGQTGGLQGDL